MSRTMLVTGGAGFIGSSLAIHFKQRDPDLRVIAFDNLRRRGAELNVGRVRAAGVEFSHGDVRVASDLEAFGKDLDVIVECSAEPSVLAGRDGQVRYVIDTNLIGCVNCLELARTTKAAFVFLSTSRVYPVSTLCRLRYEDGADRFACSTISRCPASARAASRRTFRSTARARSTGRRSSPRNC
jgi:CDP-paratose 2-epimerase